MNKIKYMCILLALVVCGKGNAQKLALSTNVMGYLYLGTVNLEASCGVAQHWSLTAGVKYNPFEFGDEQTMVLAKQQSYSAGVRFWPWHIYSGWWIAGKLQYQEYDMGTYNSRYTSEGDRFGSGVTGGYTYMINHHINMEVGLGVWAGLDRYVRYACPKCGRVVGEGSQFFFLPNDVMLSVSYVF